MLYDVIIVGGGPAGFTAAVYCLRKGLSTGIIVKQMGGQVAETSGIENYLGYRYINGLELTDKFREQVAQFGIAFAEGVAVSSIEDGDVKKVLLDDGRSFSAKALIIASGKTWRKLGVPGEQALTGRGVAYCTICDAPLFAGKKVVVVGGGNSGLESAIDLAKVASQVTVVQLIDHLTGDKVLIDMLARYPNVTYVYKHEVVEILGERQVQSVIIVNRKTQIKRILAVDGVFVEIGLVPNSSFAKGVVALNQNDEIVVDGVGQTSRPGIFAAGDVTSVPFKQIIIAGGEGAKAALTATDYILKQEILSGK